MAPTAPCLVTGGRYEELKRMLVERQREIFNDVHGKIRNIRKEGAEISHVHVKLGEAPGDYIQEDIEFTLVQMKAETLQKIDEALARLEEGTYGYCECGEEIAQPRLRALPFAVRCKDCEDAREFAQQQARVRSRNLGVLGFNY